MRDVNPGSEENTRQEREIQLEMKRLQMMRAVPLTHLDPCDGETPVQCNQFRPGDECSDDPSRTTCSECLRNGCREGGPFVEVELPRSNTLRDFLTAAKAEVATWPDWRKGNYYDS